MARKRGGRRRVVTVAERIGPTPETTYVPYADVWLNSGRFEDFIDD